MELNVRPLGDRIIIKQDTGEANIAGLSIQTDKPFSGVVVAVSSAQEMVCKVGDRVQWQGFHTTEVIINHEKYSVIREPDLLFIDDYAKTENNA